MGSRAHPLLLALSSLLAAACAEPAAPEVAERDTCTQLVDHMVELRLAEADDPRLTDEDRRQQRDGLRAVLGDAFVARCEQELDGTERACALAATSAAAMQACARGAS